MTELLNLLKDGNSRTVEMLAFELKTDKADVERQLEYLEHIGAIKRVQGLPQPEGCGGTCGSCSGCSGCEGSAAVCKGCIPKNADDNMGTLWEVV